MQDPGYEPKQSDSGAWIYSCAGACSFHIFFQLYLFFNLVWDNIYKIFNVCLRVVAQKVIAVLLLFW